MMPAYRVTEFAFPTAGTQMYVAAETKIAAKGLEGGKFGYEECVELLLHASAAREAVAAKEEPETVLKVLQGQWQTWTERRHGRRCCCCC